MSHFAHITPQNIVDNVLVVDQDFINTGALGDPRQWFQTSYNTRGGIHYDPDTGLPDGLPQLRKNFAQPGMIFDLARDAFYWSKPSTNPSFIFNENSCLWEPPIPYPTDGKSYYWSEKNLAWLLMPD